MEGHRKRKPLSDISNTHDLIPTPSLRKLVAASANSGTSSKPPISILKSSSVSSNQKPCPESSNRSEISIGSHNVGRARSSRAVQFHTPPREISSITRPGGRGSKDTPYNRKQTTEKITKEREDAVVFASPTFLERRKNKGKDIAVPFGSSPPYKTKDNRNEFLNPSILFKRENQKGSAYRNIFSGLVEITKESKKLTLNSLSHPYGKAEKPERTINGEKSGSSSDRSKRIHKQSGLSGLKTKKTGKVSIDPTFLIERTREKGKAVMQLSEALNPVGHSIERTREKGKAIMQLSEAVEATKYKCSSAAVKVNTQHLSRKSVRGKTDAGPSSCPPMRRTDFDEAEDMKPPKSWTDVDPIPRKRSKVNESAELSLEFVEQQNAYFKEIDAFELPEEEISEDELD